MYDLLVRGTHGLRPMVRRGLVRCVCAGLSVVLPRQAFRDQGDRGHGEGIPRLLVPYQGLPHRHGASHPGRPHRRAHRNPIAP